MIYLCSFCLVLHPSTIGFPGFDGVFPEEQHIVDHGRRKFIVEGSLLSKDMQRGYDLGAEFKNINILLNINCQGAFFGKEFQGGVSDSNHCQVLRGKMPLIPSRLKALLIFLRDISTLERGSTQKQMLSLRGNEVLKN